ncbi:NUDIX hydrolase [Nocardioides daphniae]|uniref:CoA pyrophosphatase n=1 Tax=Nocardioides daphniae TaxID=402297 RepID=A0A4P7UEM9_9ACTN|nr:CoA pyrophosphatase [Nocardioides daphniae]QCC78374.1 CoA pyrophosphatase [Nocardioides daphniae]GGD13081.1 coenzyme A pyrophosphatase [Nocardioides daphniae]
MSEVVQDPDRFPEWLRPVVEGAGTITVDDLTRFAPPPGVDARRGAVLMLFAESENGEPEVLLTERAHHMRTQPGQVSFPGGGIDEGETVVEAALREAYEEIGLVSAEIDVFGQLPDLWLPPANYVVTPVLGYWRDRGIVHVASPDEVHAIHHESIAELLDPEHRFNVRHPSGWVGPGFSVGAEKEVILWGFTAGIIARLFDHVGWTTQWDKSRVRDLPPLMLQGNAPGQADLAPNTKLRE